MYIPEYTITTNTLKSISLIEYNRSFIENTSILPSFEQRLKKEALVEIIVSSLKALGELPNIEVIKKYVDDLTRLFSPQIVNIRNAIEQLETMAERYEIEENDLKYMHTLISKNILPVARQGLYRSTRTLDKVEPETILAEVNDLIDWYNSLDALDTNPVIVAGILKGKLETIQPFERLNQAVADLCVRNILKSRGYSFIDLISPERKYVENKREYDNALHSIIEEEGDFTVWLEYFTELVSTQLATLAEKYKLYARDTRLAKVNGRLNLTPRQVKIVEYLQDYGLLQNNHFPRLFPDISEDSILRDLKKLTDMGIVVKRGKTKSSRYEMR